MRRFQIYDFQEIQFETDSLCSAEREPNLSSVLPMRGRAFELIRSKQNIRKCLISAAMKESPCCPEKEREKEINIALHFRDNA